MELIKEGDTVIFQASSGRYFFEEALAKRTIRFKKSVYNLSPLIGAPYGAIFEAQKKDLVRVSGGLFPDPVSAETGEAQVPVTDNRHYADTNSAQKLTMEEIGKLRQEGSTGHEIIQKIIENSDTWDSKTEFSKQKYLKKKQQKYMPRVRVLKSSAQLLCKTYHLKSPSKICNLREDSLAQILSYGNIYAGCRTLVVDTCMGLTIGAIAERMGGFGRILAPFEGQQASIDTVRRFNFDASTLSSIVSFPFKYFSWLDQTEEHIEACHKARRSIISVDEQAAREEKVQLRHANLTDEQRQAYEAKKAARALRSKSRLEGTEIRDNLREGVDSLILACSYNPEAVLFTLLPLLKSAKPFVVYSEFLEPLTTIFHKLQQGNDCVNLQLNTTWTREYQVLPGRTHPDMTMSSCGGYLLSGIKVESSSIKQKKRKTDQ